MSLFSTEDRLCFLDAFGGDIPVKLNGALFKTLKGVTQFEEVVASGIDAEIGSSVLTLQIDKADCDSLDKSKKYTFVIDGVSYISRGPALQDGSGFVKLMLTKA